MNRFGTRLSRTLYWVMLVLALVLGIAALAGVMVMVIGTVSPEELATVKTTINGRPVTGASAIQIGVLIVATASLAGAIVWQLIGLLRAAAAGHPFVAANVRRLRAVAALLTVAAFAGPLAMLIVPAAAGEARGEIDGGSLLGALLALVLAEVFRAGVALSEDAAGTV